MYGYETNQFLFTKKNRHMFILNQIKLFGHLHSCRKKDCILSCSLGNSIDNTQKIITASELYCCKWYWINILLRKHNSPKMEWKDLNKKKSNAHTCHAVLGNLESLTSLQHDCKDKSLVGLYLDITHQLTLALLEHHPCLSNWETLSRLNSDFNTCTWFSFASCKSWPNRSHTFTGRLPCFLDFSTCPLSTVVVMPGPFSKSVIPMVQPLLCIVAPESTIQMFGWWRIEL